MHSVQSYWLIESLLFSLKGIRFCNNSCWTITYKTILFEQIPKLFSLLFKGMPRNLAHFTWTMSAFSTSQTFCRLARRKVVQELQLELPSLDAEDQEPFDSDEDWDSLQFARVTLQSRGLWKVCTKGITAERILILQTVCCR